MPVNPTYPGVYIEEVPSGVRTITGVATSITAFVGRAMRGPVNEATIINSYGDFERMFGGLWPESSLGNSVRDFYSNGGGQAVVVRLFHADEGANAKPAKAKLSANGLNLEAAYAGAWGNSLRARVDHDTRELEEGETANSLFNLAIRDGKTGEIERFLNLSITPGHPSEVKKALMKSKLVRLDGAIPTARPNAHPAPATKRDVWSDPDPDEDGDEPSNSKVADAAMASDGASLVEADFTGAGLEGKKEGLYALERADLFNLLCIPPYNNGNVDATLIAEAATYCEKRRAMLLVDSPSAWSSKEDARQALNNGGVGTKSKNAALFFPRLDEGRAPSGAIAGLFARTDTNRGVWKAPAGLEATLNGVQQLSVALTDAENGELNPLGINCIRSMPPAGRVVWGARTLQGDDRFASEWRYIPVRRLALYIEESLYRGTQWVVFEPNDEPLWSQIRLNVGAFMNTLFRQGAFAGRTPSEAYFVKCDKETTTANDINLGRVNLSVGFAPLKPAEFVIIRIQQIARAEA